MYKRYDPVDGHLEKVTKDDPRYDEWRKTKGTVASRKKALLKSDPLEYAQTFGAKAVSDRATRAASAGASKVARRLSPSLVGLASAVAPAAIAIGAIGAAIYAMQKIGEHMDVSDGEKINQISRQFVATQQDVVKKLGVRSWADVPLDLRTKLLNGYKAAVAHVTEYRQGIFQPSKSLPTLR